MPSKYISLFSVSIDEPDLSHLDKSVPLPQGLIDKRKNLRFFIDQQMYTFISQIQSSIYSKKVQIGDPVVNVLGMRITRFPKPGLDLAFDGGIWADVEFDPRKLQELPNDNKLLGEFNIKLGQQALEKYDKYPDFPTEVVRDAMYQYRKSDYTLHTHTRRGNIEGIEKVKAQVDIYANCIETWRVFSLTYRGKVLFSKEITRVRPARVPFCDCCHKVVFEDNILTFYPIDPEELAFWESKGNDIDYGAMLFPTQIDLDEFSEAKGFLISKGLINL